jgi:hypothetical protein
VCHIINLVVQAAIRFITSTPQMISRFAEYCKAQDMRPRNLVLI